MIKILFAADDSKSTLAALDLRIPRLQWFREPASLTLVNVHAKLPYAGAASYAGTANVEDYYDEESRKALAPALSRLADRGINAEVVTLVGDAAEEIANYAATAVTTSSRWARTAGQRSRTS